MPANFGTRYQPGADDTRFAHGQDNTRETTVPQQAIRTLSLRVPQTTSTPSVAPLPLLNARGGGGTDLDMLLMALLRAFAPQGVGAGRQAVPRITPGFTDPTVSARPTPLPRPQPPQDFPLPEGPPVPIGPVTPLF
jgi:hypothetical protein